MAQNYETHIERAARLGVAADAVKADALAGRLGSYGSSEGIIYLPVGGDNMRFFVEMMAKKHCFDPDW